MGSQQQHDMYYDGHPSGRSPGSHRHQNHNQQQQQQQQQQHQHQQHQQQQPHQQQPHQQHQQQQQTVHRAPSRQFDPFAQIPGGLYTAEDHAVRYETNRFDRMAPPFQPGYPYDMSGAQTWNPSGFGGGLNGMPSMAATGRVKPSRLRSALPAVSGPSSARPPPVLTSSQTWLDQHSPLSPSNPYPGLGIGNGPQSSRADTHGTDVDEELIPTAIVIKNIPFAAKKEQLVQLMTDMNLPLPYAFNYHFDNGVFRGLAFANFTTADETAAVIEHLNHFELQGRKLRVEYKKMLPLAERERIEREKRERRGQLEEQHRPMPTLQLHNQPSMSSMSSHIPATSPSPVSMRSAKPGRSRPDPTPLRADAAADVDLNDAQTLQFYTQLMLFKEDKSKEALIFPSTLLPAQRRTVHTLAYHLSLSHVSRGNGEQRQVHVFRAPQPSNNMSPPIPQLPGGMFGGDPQKRGLNRAATIDFSEARGSDPAYGTLGRQSSGLLDIPGSPGGGPMATASANLRAAKSFADLRSYTPSPVPSSASFPAAVNRFNDYGQLSLATAGPGLNPTASNSMNAGPEDAYLVNGLGGLSLGGSFSAGGNGSREPRPLMPFERDGQQNQQSFGGPIGSNRQFSVGHDDQTRERGQALPLRQPRGPAPERGTGFSRNRQNGHHQAGNNDLESASGVEIIVE
ncbi:MAG: hypothetical protein M1832_001312 [Thelocarpon impressellum]|nr:MAG: hypothetical protein M1832_001312 [Thelocarpon impressellum]